VASSDDPFFSLKGDVRDVEKGEFLRLVGSKDEININNLIYRPDRLVSDDPINRWRIHKKKFKNFSFSKTLIERFQFTECQFDECMFIGTLFVNCRFEGCKFSNSNTFRMELKDTYIDPNSFIGSITEKRYSNIAVDLFHELLNNSRRESQPKFSDDALYHFRKWKIIHAKKKSYSSKLSKFFHTITDTSLYWVFDYGLGFGVRFKNLACMFAFCIVFLALMNWSFSEQLGLSEFRDGFEGFVDAIYFSIIVITTLGFGDIVPTTVIGRFFVSFQAILGFVLLATFASMIFRKISQ